MSETRAGAFAWDTKPVYRANEDRFLSLKPEVKPFTSEAMLVLPGYKGDLLGLVNGASRV